MIGATRIRIIILLQKLVSYFLLSWPGSSVVVLVHIGAVVASEAGFVLPVITLAVVSSVATFERKIAMN